MWIGLAFGFTASAVFWGAFASVHSLQATWAVIVFLTFKVSAGLLLTGSIGWTHFGKGLLLSVGLVLLIVFGTCGMGFFR